MGVCADVLSAFGIALVFPILTIALLDMSRTSAQRSSMQAFVGLLSNALIAACCAADQRFADEAGAGRGLLHVAPWHVAWYLAHASACPRRAATRSLEPTDEL